MDSSDSPPEKTLPQTITRHLKRSKFSGKYADFKITIGKKVFPTHKFILGNKSAYFRDLLQTERDNHSPALLEYTEYTAEAVGICLEFMYTDRLDIKPQNAAAVAIVAHRWNLQYVVTKCQQMLKNCLNSTNCVKVRALSTELGLKELGECANKIILGNFQRITKAKELSTLSIDDIKLIKDTAIERASVRIKDLWILYDAWCKRKSAESEHKMCDSIDIIPFGQLTVTGFKEHVWKHEHVSTCETCQTISAHKFLEGTDSILAGDDVLFLLKLAKRYKFQLLQEIVYRHIVQHHVEIFTRHELDSLESDDLMRCINEIEDMCTPGEFTAIVKWMEKSPERQDVFPQIFKYAEDPTKIPKTGFLSSFCGFFGLSEPTAKETIFADQSDQYWWPKHCLFLKKLAKKYSCVITEKFVDQCIIGGFESVSQDEGFLDLSDCDLIKYLSSRSTYSSDKNEIWDAIMRWIRHNETVRKQCFQGIFDSLKLDEFETSFLKSTIMTNEFVMESKSCLFSIVREMLGRLEVMEKKQGDMQQLLQRKNNKY